MSEKDMLIVLAASYDTVSDAEADYEAVKELYDAAGIGHSFDAAVLERGDDGKVKVVDKSAFAKLAAARRRLSCVD